MSKMSDYDLFLCEYFNVDDVAEAIINREITQEQLHEASEEYFNKQYK